MAERSYYVLRQIDLPASATWFSDIGYEEIGTPVARSPEKAAERALREHGTTGDPAIFRIPDLIVIPATAIRTIRIAP